MSRRTTGPSFQVHFRVSNWTIYKELELSIISHNVVILKKYFAVDEQLNFEGCLSISDHSRLHGSNVAKRIHLTLYE